MTTPSHAAEEVLRYMSAVSALRAGHEIESLDRASGQGGSPAAERRREPRDPYSTLVTIRTQVHTAVFGTGGPPREALVEVFARNLSPSGFGFLVPEIYLPDEESGCVLAIRGEDVFTPGKMVDVSIMRPGGRSRWLAARLVRARVLDSGFVECGVEFV
jgi:hypothetical protein